MDWKKVIGPWDFKKSQADTKYNEGTHIATKEEPIWIIPQSCGRPITIHHTPCGYWLKEYASPEILTSELYPLEAFGYIDSSGSSIIAGILVQEFFLIEYEDFGYIDSSDASILCGKLRNTKRKYSIPFKAINSSAASIISGELKSLLIKYSTNPGNLNSSDATILSGNLEDVLIKYENWPAESINSSGAAITEGNLE